MALALHERGAFTWKEWAQTLAAVIGEVKERGEADTGSDYYRHWLTALERIAARKGIVTEALLQRRRQRMGRRGATNAARAADRAVAAPAGMSHRRSGCGGGP